MLCVSYMCIGFFMCVSTSLSLSLLSSASTSAILFKAYMNGTYSDGRRGPVVGV